MTASHFTQILSGGYVMSTTKRSIPNRLLFLTALITVYLISSAIAVSAAPPTRGPVYHKSPVVTLAPRPTRYIRALPYGYRTFLYGGLTYYFFNGHYYYHGPHGYAVVAAPVGATIRFLPPGAVVVTVGATSYYTQSGVYYQDIPEGYRVVNPPIVVETPSKDLSAKADYVLVATAALNIRSGPGMDRPIINQVLEGDVLEIQATGPEWYYVKLPDETSGWVMKKYTSPLAPIPVG